MSFCILITPCVVLWLGIIEITILIKPQDASGACCDSIIQFLVLT